ncbi:Ca(2+)-binding ATP:ADP antiporter SAL1 [Ascoidea rubescens DSM 1968]|uniref:Mitochondrial carrier n=1 Tax=Ascoidea rubescens DSM 1968 TaxID=1344418 RepID=A0A1D2VAK2_9ASCO|nr:mitochondrial carrier [Ascoidea rubescens DSM 1968]ODV58453.1 mitochondrial carrier [Ascoidea rubescens DSM 1968]
MDTDNDGKLNKFDIQSYLHKTLNINANDKIINQFYQKLDKDNHGYITYNQWRDFLLFMPRNYGSRLKTAFHYFNEDIDLSSEGDMTLINDFIRGFGYFLAGGMAGVVSRTCTAPFDRLKVFLIARTDLSSTIIHSKEEIAKTGKNHPPIDKIKSPLVKAATSIYRQGGLRGFYVGNGLNVLKVFPEAAMKFGSFEATKRFLAKIEGVKDTSHLSRVSTYLAGGIGGVVSQFAVYPIDTLKYRVQCAKLDTELKGFQLLTATAKEMYSQGGLKLFYRGVIVGVAGIFPYAAIDLGTFSSLKKYMILREAIKLNIPEEDVKLSNLIVLPMGAFSGTVGATFVYPVNLLRTRLQAQGTFAHPYKYTGIGDVFVQTIKREGYAGLFKGLVPNLAKVCPAVSISYLVYENMKGIMDLT